MLKSLSTNLREAASQLLKTSAKNTKDTLLQEYSITVDDGTDGTLLSTLLASLSKIPKDLVVACGIKNFIFENLGPSKEYFPNHGYYVNNTLCLNSELVSDNKLWSDPTTNKFLNRFDHTLYHELGHGLDDLLGNISEKEPWLKLSGWSLKPAEGLKRVRINEPGSPEILGEWYYDPSAGFSRFYAKRNPWDDFADSFSFYVAGLKGFLPDNKKKFLEDILKKYTRNDI
jgi:hypothetical protein